MVNYSVTKNDVKIYDSWTVGKKEFKSTLTTIHEAEPDSDVWKRKMCSLCLEWATHNACYALGIKRSSTKDVDLNYPQKWYIAPAYNVVGALVWLFIK